MWRLARHSFRIWKGFMRNFQDRECPYLQEVPDAYMFFIDASQAQPNEETNSTEEDHKPSTSFNTEKMSAGMQTRTYPRVQK
jgi:hypothetical protein